MNVFARASLAYEAFRGNSSTPGTRLREMPNAEQMRKIRGDRSYSSRKGTKPFQRLSMHSRRWLPPDVEGALAQCDGAGVLRDAMMISGWVQSDPIVSGIAKGLTMIPHGQVGVLYSDEAAAWLEGTKNKPGMRTQIAPPSELVVSASNEFFGGSCVGLLVRDEALGIPVYEALDPVGLRYQHSRRTWQFHGWSTVFDITTDDFISNECGQLELNPWVLGTLSKNRPWFEGQWHKLGYKVMHAQLSAELRGVFENGFSLPIVVARTPQGASNDQRAKFTESILGAFLRVIGVTPGYDVELKQATAEGAEVYTQSEKNLIEAASIAIWGTTGLISGGQGFANADLFEQMAAKIISAFAAHLARRDNGQIWRRVLQWAAQRGYISKAAANAQIEYRTDSAAVIATKAKAAKLLVDVGVSQEEARKQVGLSSLAMPGTKADELTAQTPRLVGAIQSAVQIVTAVAANQMPRDAGIAQLKYLTNVETAEAEEMMGTAGAGFVASVDGTTPPPATILPEAREEEEPEPTYSEMVAEQLNARNEAVCPCSNHADRHCPRCGVVRRKEVQDGQWIDTWKPTRRRAA
jgi:hypothetical protein